VRIGIIPAAGVAKRWGYYPKFLLPCGDREWLLDRAIRAMPVRKVVVVYGDETNVELFRHVERCGLQDKVIFKENKHMELDLYGSILAGLEETAHYYFFAMPDTYWPLDVFPKMPVNGITLGVHRTDMPERFGMLRDGMVVNKQMGDPGLAWGLLGWDREVRDLWLASHLETYTDAINLAMQECSWNTVKMSYYYDMASFRDYIHFLRNLKINMKALNNG